MIIKIHNGSDIFAPLNYNFTKVDEGEADILGIENCYRAQNINEVLHLFNERATKNSRVKYPIFTVSINPAIEDLSKLSDIELKQIADDYMQRMGYGDQPYIVFRHRDIERHHLHIVSLRVGADGKKISSDFERYKSVEIRKQLEKEYNLARADDRKISRDELISQQADYIKKYELDERVENKDSEKRKKYRKILHYVKSHYKCTSMVELRHVLSLFSLYTKEVSDENGEHKGIVFYPLNEDGRDGKALSGSYIGKEFSYNKFQQYFEKNAKNLDEKKKNEKKYIRSLIDASIDKLSRKITVDELAELLKTQGIYVCISRRKETGEIFGINFISTISGIVYKASDLGKEYSASKLQERLTAQSFGRKLTKPEQNNVIKALKNKYNEIRKTSYYYEGNLIEDIENYRAALTDIAMRSAPMEGRLNDVFLIVNTFINYKKDLLETTRNKEFDYLRSQLDVYAPFISSLDTNKRKSFVEALGYTFTTEDNQAYIHSLYDKRLKVSVHSTGMNFDFNDSITNKYLFNKDEKIAIKAILSGNIEEIKSPIEISSKLYNYLSTEQSEVVMKRSTQLYITSVNSENDNIYSTLSELYNKGLVIRTAQFEDGRIRYVIGNYKDNTLRSFIPIPQEWEKQLNNINYMSSGLQHKILSSVYTNIDKGYTNKHYTALVMLNAALSKNNEKYREISISYALDYISKNINSELATTINQKIREKENKDNILMLLKPITITDLKQNNKNRFKL